jgi:hypothetical protein
MRGNYEPIVESPRAIEHLLGHFGWHAGAGAEPMCQIGDQVVCRDGRCL